LVIFSDAALLYWIVSTFDHFLAFFDAPPIAVIRAP